MEKIRASTKNFKEEGKKNKNENPKPFIKSKPLRIIFTFLLFILGFTIIYISYIAVLIGPLLQWTFALVSLLLIGIIIRVINGFQGSSGLYLLSTKKGLSIIDSISKKGQWFWKHLPIWGIMLGFGLLSYPLLKGKISKYDYIFGIISLIFILLIVLPSTAEGIQFINLPQLQSSNISANLSNTSSGASTSSNNILNIALILPIISLAIGIIFGLTGYIMFLLVYLTAIDFVALGNALTVTAPVAKTQMLQSIVPGLAPVIPGIDTPLLAGLVSLIILLIIHEFSHGILSRIEKVKLKSLGLVIFGVIPIGAFVEPDEKEVLKLKSMKQTRIFAAGSAINLLASILFFALMILMLYFVMPNIYSNAVFIQSIIPNTPAYNVLKPGMQILAWNNVPIKNISSFAIAAANDLPGKQITVLTNKGTYSFNAISIDNSTKGYIGITIGNRIKTGFSSQLLYFIFTTIVLSFIFNLSIGIINLLPLPFFDGWRIYKTNIKNKNIINAFVAFVSIIFLINVLFLIISVSAF
ncbi:MAG: site-2 protease family protein [Candidatus Micrarchaeia archaeon]